MKCFSVMSNWLLSVFTGNIIAQKIRDFVAALSMSVEDTKQRSIYISGETDIEADSILVGFGLPIRKSGHGLVVVLFESVVYRYSLRH